MKQVKVFDSHKCTTSIHNALFDTVMPEISGNAWKILSLIIRQTDGWNRDEIGLSYPNLMIGTGIRSRATISAALCELEPLNLLIISTNSKWEENHYSLNLETVVDWIPRNFASPPSSKIEPAPSSKIEPAPSSKIELFNRKESISETREREYATSLTDSLSSLLCELHGINEKSGWRMQDKFQSLAIELTGLNATIEQVKAFWASRTKSKPALNYFAGDFTTWRAGKYTGNGYAKSETERKVVV